MHVVFGLDLCFNYTECIVFSRIRLYYSGFMIEPSNYSIAGNGEVVKSRLPSLDVIKGQKGHHAGGALPERDRIKFDCIMSSMYAWV